MVGNSEIWCLSWVFLKHQKREVILDFDNVTTIR